MTLLRPVSLVPPADAGALHFVAIGGAGMSGIAAAYHQRGLPVSGCDAVDSDVLQELTSLGIQTCVGHDPAHLADVDTLVISTAIRAGNPELIAAQERGLRIWHRSAALAALMLDKVAISIAGSHGKTTTAAMTAVLLAAAGADPSYVIGGPLASTRKSYHLADGELFVVEADESDGSFLQYPTQYAVITNIEADHLDNWENPERYAEGFHEFATGDLMRGVVINVDDPGARQLADRLRAEGRSLLTYGASADADVRLVEVNAEGSRPNATLIVDGKSWPLSLQAPGLHNLQNAAAAFALGRMLGLDETKLLAGAQEFTGTLRRFQFIGQPNVGDGHIRVYDDYAHHPTELRAALTAARSLLTEDAEFGRLIACFQPHLFTRTKDFADEFGQALTLADVVVVSDVYPSREDPIPGVTGQLVSDAVTAAGFDSVHYVQNKVDLPAFLADLAQPGDLVITLGAGDVTLVGPLLVNVLNDRGGEK